MKRVYHTWDRWECYPAGFYDNKHPTLDEDQCRDLYASFLRDIPGFERAMGRVLIEWPNSSEHYLSNESMNRIAWLGQASMCIAHGVPSQFRGGFNRLSTDEQQAANLAALKFLNIWLQLRGDPPLTLEEAKSKTEANLY